MSRVSTALLDELLVKSSRTFALSIPELPHPTRREVTVAYLLFRIADTLEDATEWSTTRQCDELERFGQLLDAPTIDAARGLAESWRASPPLRHAGYLDLLTETPAVVEALLELDAAARVLICRHTRRTVDRMAEFVRRSDSQRGLQLRDVADLQAYCYAVAGIVGEMLTELFLLHREPLMPIAGVLRGQAARFGEALQLVNILKDSGRDAREGRRYLPASIAAADIFALARADLEAARQYVLELQQAGAPRGLVAFTALPVLLAWRTLDRVESEGPSSKLTRSEVAAIVQGLELALRRNTPAVPLPGSAP
jgi:farnesyl-diphosphate farnesyltransferase